jgi:two-component system, sensor histidine kinase
MYDVRMEERSLEVTGKDRLNRPRVLIADGNRDAADSLGQLLLLWGYEVRVAYSGPAALEAARAWRPGIVLADIVLPGLDGYQLARSLRAERQRTVLIALTGLGREVDRLRSQAAGFDHHLVKPAKLDELHQLLAVSAYCREVQTTLAKKNGLV